MHLFKNAEFLVLCTAILSSFWVIVYGLFYAMGESDMRMRMRRVLDGGGTIRARNREKNGVSLAVRLKKIQDIISVTFTRITKKRSDGFRRLFEKAGWDHGRASYLYPTMKIISIFIFYILAYFLAARPMTHPMAPMIRLGIYGIGFYVGFRFVDIIMDFIIKNRYKRIQKGLSSALDLMVVATRAGLGLDKTFEIVARETSLSNPDLCQELTITCIELSLFPDRRLAFDNLSKRLDFPLIRSMTTTLVQSEQQGTSVSQTLKGLADDFRQQKIFEAEGRAAKLPALLTVPIIVFIFPILMMIILGPSIIQLSSSFDKLG